MKRRRWKQLLAGTLALGMVLSTATGGGKAVPVQAQEPSKEEEEWKELSAILDSYQGIYTKDTRFGSPWNTDYNPDGPLMGNGTVYAFMAGDQKEQNLYISHSNMWQDGNGNVNQEYTTFGGITIKPNYGENLALSKKVTVCAQNKDSEGGACLVDGKINTKWCTTAANNGGVSDKYWAVVDLGEDYDISRWVVRHAQAGGENSDYNTKEFKLQYYDGEETPDGAVDEQWEDADAVTDNTASVTDRNLKEPIKARYVRLLITKATQGTGTTIRIPEFELYAEPGPVNLALGKPATACSSHSDASGPSFMLDGKISSDSKWCSTPSTNNGSSIYWAVVDLEKECDIARWVVKHAQAGGESSDWNTRDFKLQYYAGNGEEKPDGAVEEQWTDADAVTGNTESVTDRNLEQPIKARYVRLLVTKATQNGDNAVRIPEFELYAEPCEIQGNSQEFRYVQDMKNAEVTAQSKNGFTTVNWISGKENILVTEITNVTEKDLPLEVTAWTANANTTATVDGNKMIATKAGISKANADWPFGDGTWEGWTINIAMASQIVGDVEVTTKNMDDHKNSSTFVLAPGQKVTLVSAIEGGKQEGTEENTHEQAVEKATAKLDTRLTQKALDTSKQNHRDHWKDYWLRSYIDIQDETVERVYYGRLYQMGCASSIASENNGGVAAGLFPWTAVEHPAWLGDYTANTDFQRQVHPLVTSNRPEALENYLNIVEQFWPEAERRSESVENLNWIIEGNARPQFTEGIEGGALFPTHLGPWGAATERRYNWIEYWNSPSEAVAVMMPVIKWWKYTYDEELLARIYPMMKAVSIFWEGYVTLEDGKYVVYGATHEGIKGRNAILDLDACKYMLRNTILAANELGVDQDKVEIWQNILDNMSPVPTFIYNGKETICDVEGRTQNNTAYTFNGNPVTIQSVYYYDSIGMSASDAEKEKYFNYLARGNGSGSHRRLISATRLGYDIDSIMNAFKSSINANPSDWQGLRGNNTAGDIGAAAGNALIQDSLIQSNEGFINIFANWYDDQETSFRRLGAENAFLVDADMNSFGQVTYVNIHSDKGRDCSVLNPWQNKNIAMKVLKDGKEVAATVEKNNLGDVYTFKTEVGADYELVPAEELEIHFNIEGSSDVFMEDTLQLMVKTTAVDPTIKWESSDEEIATIDANGLVTPKRLGDTTITATIQGREDISDSRVIHVVEKIPADGFSAVADSEENNGKDGPASYTVDGDESTFWHSGYSSGKVQPDINNNKNNSITIDLGATYNVGRLDYVPRQNVNNGTITKYEIWYSTEAEGENFIKISEGSWEDNDTTKSAQFDTVLCRRIRLRAMETNGMTQNKNKWITAAEFYLYKTVPEEGSIAEIVTKISKITLPVNATWEDLNAILPSEVEVKLETGAKALVPVEWNADDFTGESGKITGNLVCSGAITNPNNLQVEAEFEVKEKIELNVDKLEIEAGTKEKLSATTNMKDPNIIWTSSDQEVAVVGTDGVVLGLKEGVSDITATLAGKDVSAKCTVTVTRAEGVNVALDGNATSSDHYEDFTADRVINGAWTPSYEGWVSRFESSDAEKAKWLQIDLGKEYTIERWLLRHEGWREGVTGDDEKNSQGNWGNYYLQVSPNGIDNWTDVDVNLDNKCNTTDRTLETPVTGRYFRIYIEYPMLTGGGFIRLHQIELYAVPEEPEEIIAAEIQKMNPKEVDFGTAFDGLSLPETVTVRLSNDMFVDFPVIWEKGIYDENKSGEYTLSGILTLPERITNRDNLTAAITVKVNAPITAKGILQRTYDYALNLSTEGATDSAREYFEKALANAKAVLENPDATQEVINKACNDLLDAIRGLGVVKGDLTYLKLLIDKAKNMVTNQDKYVDTNWQKLVDELNEGEAVYNDEYASQKDVDKAVAGLLDAILIQRYKANKANLAELIEKADNMELTGYTQESVQALKNALAAAKDIMADASLSVDDQKKVDLAAKELNDAIQNLVKVSDGDDGNDNTGDGGNTGNGDNNGDNGNTGNGDNTGDGGNTGNGDNTGDGGNTGNGDNNGDNGNTGDGGNTGDTDNKGTTSDKGDAANAGKTDTPKTGDAFSVMFWIRAMLLAGLGTACVIIRRKTEKR